VIPLSRPNFYTEFEDKKVYITALKKNRYVAIVKNRKGEIP